MYPSCKSKSTCTFSFSQAQAYYFCANKSHLISLLTLAHLMSLVTLKRAWGSLLVDPSTWVIAAPQCLAGREPAGTWEHSCHCRCGSAAAWRFYYYCILRGSVFKDSFSKAIIAMPKFVINIHTPLSWVALLQWNINVWIIHKTLFFWKYQLPQYNYISKLKKDIYLSNVGIMLEDSSLGCHLSFSPHQDLPDTHSCSSQRQQKE